MVESRQNNLSAALEDYLEAIYNLSGDSNVARSKDIAESLGVSKASVTGALRALKKKGLANYKPYDYVTLTKSGIETAAIVASKHEILMSFFINVLGVDSDTAQKAACRAEHTLGPEVIKRLVAFIEFVSKNSEKGSNLASQFHQFYEKSSKRKRKGS